jgi:hypothetical protein
MATVWGVPSVSRLRPEKATAIQERERERERERDLFIESGRGKRKRESGAEPAGHGECAHVCVELVCYPSCSNCAPFHQFFRCASKPDKTISQHIS